MVANLSSLAARVTMSQVKVCAKESQLWLVIVLSPSKACFAYPSSSVTAFGTRVGALIRMWRGLEQKLQMFPTFLDAANPGLAIGMVFIT